MRRKLYSILIGLLSIFLLAMAGACSKGSSDESGDVSITLSQTAIELDAYERVEISAEVENSTESVVWTVENPAVATVENGMIIAKSVGETTVTATVDETSAICAVRVYKSGEEPKYTLSDEKLSLFTEDTYKYYLHAT